MKKNVLLHAIIIVGCLCSGVLLCAVQTSFLPHYLNDALFVPDLLLCLTVGLGVMAGPVYGAFFGIFAGVLADCTGGCGIFLLPLLYMICGYAAHVCADLIPNRKIPVYFATGAAACALRAMVAIIYVLLSVDNVQVIDVIRYVCIPLILGTLVFLPIMYLASLLLTLPIRFIKHQTIDNIL